jgi:hypothetical protein
MIRLCPLTASATAEGSRPKQWAEYPPVNRPYLTHEDVDRDGNYPVPPGVDVVVEKSQLRKRRPANDFVKDQRGVSQHALHAFSPLNPYVRFEILESPSVVGFPGIRGLLLHRSTASRPDGDELERRD